MSFFRHYEAQPLFADIDPYVRSQGFDLNRHLLHFNRKRHAYIGAADKAALENVDGQLLQADALYFRTPARVAKHLQALSAKDRIRYLAGGLVACLTYNKLDLAARYIHEAGSMIEPRGSTLMLELLRCTIPTETVNLGQTASSR